MITVPQSTVAGEHCVQEGRSTCCNAVMYNVLNVLNVLRSSVLYHVI